jgi:hypothetical protein
MGWGVCFDLDANGRVYCADGCKWRATKADYAGYPVWPSAQSAVLEYFEDEAHRELDMIRDECPGTAAALDAACHEHIGSALHYYERLSDQEKTDRHLEMLDGLTTRLNSLEEKKKLAYTTYVEARKAYKAYTPPTKTPKTRVEELENIIAPLDLELAMERAARSYDNYKSELTRVKRDIRLENQFKL